MGKYLTRMETNFILTSIDLSRINAVLDVGAEAGRFSQLTTNGNASVVSIDIEPTSLKRLKLKNKAANVIQADGRKIPLRESLLDAIFAIEVLDYIPELDQVIAECYRILKPNSSLFLTFGNKSSLKSKLRALRGNPYRHSYSEVAQSMQKTSFRLKRKMGYNWLPLGRMSENPLIPLLATLERIFGLRKAVRFSPWVMVQAEKPLDKSHLS